MRRGNEYNIDQFLSSREITTFWKSFFGSCRHKSFRFDIGVLLHTSPNWLLKLIYISCCLCNPIRGSWVARHLIGGSSEMAWTPIGWVGRSRRPRVHGLIVASAGALSRSQYALLSLSLSLVLALPLTWPPSTGVRVPKGSTIQHTPSTREGWAASAAPHKIHWHFGVLFTTEISYLQLLTVRLSVSLSISAAKGMVRFHFYFCFLDTSFMSWFSQVS